MCIAKPSQIGAAADVHQDVEVFTTFRFTNEDCVEGLSRRVTARPDAKTVPGFVHELGVFEGRPILRPNGKHDV
jgi:hypothetical protein